ncbi:MAG TPA: carboxypeptidase-like regulatory domain-containing protein, partial [Planctomycetota bacterium]
ALEVVGLEPGRSVTTGADGSYELAGLPAGIFHVHWLRALEGASVRDLEMLVTLAAGEERTLDLQPRGHTTVRGTLSLADGTLPRVVPIQLHSRRGDPHAWADGLRGTFALDGRFELDHVESGPWSLVASVEAPELRMGWLRVEVPAEGSIEVQLTIEARR